MKLQFYDNLIAMPMIKDMLVQVRELYPPGEDGTDQFVQLVPYLQFNVPYGELLTLIDEKIEPRKWAEFDPLTQKLSKPTKSMGLFQKYSTSEDLFTHGYSLFFFGPNGSGKTMLALKILCSHIERGKSGFYLHFKEYMQVYNDSSIARDQHSMTLTRHIERCDMLILDEMGKESKVSANVIGELERLLKQRSANRKPTIILSNLPAVGEASFEQRYGNSVYDILLQRYKFIQFSKENNFRAKLRENWQL